MKGKKFLLGIKVRPYLEEFLLGVSKYYNIVIWSEMKKDVVYKVLKLIPQLSKIKKRFSRENC